MFRTSLLWFFLDYFENFKQDKNLQNYSRLSPDVEKLFSDTRSFLDPIYELAVIYTQDEYLGPVPKSRRKSFGQFADWYEKDSIQLSPPLSFFSDLVLWGQTIRQLRNFYIHHGHEGVAFIGKRRIYFDLNWRKHGKSPRKLPSIFYPKHRKDNYVYLDRLVLYVVLPVFALRFVLADFLNSAIKDFYSGWVNSLDNGQPYQSGSLVRAFYNLMSRNRQMLKPSIYMKTYY